MNLRRGLFRIWLVVSILFVISVAVDSYGLVRTKIVENRGEPTWFDKYAVLPVDCAKALGSEGADYERKDGFCWYEMAKFRKLYPEYNDVNDRILVERVYAKAGFPPAQGLWSLLLEKALLAFGYPLAALAVGYAALWAFSGFRADAKAKAS